MDRELIQEKSGTEKNFQDRSRVRMRSEEDNMEKEMLHYSTRGTIQVPTLSDYLGKEGLKKLRQEEKERQAKLNAQEGERNVVPEEAIGHGAASSMSGANDSAWQDQC